MQLESPLEYEIARTIRDISRQNLSLDDKERLYIRCLSEFRDLGVIADYNSINGRCGAYHFCHDFDFCQHAGIPYDDISEHVIDIRLALALLCEKQLFPILA